MKTIPFAWAACMLWACNAGPVQPLSNTSANYPPADTTRYSEPFAQMQREPVCQGEHELLTLSSGRQYILSPAQSGGAFGSFHLAMSADGSVWGVKQMHDNGDFPMSEEDVRRELGLWHNLGRGVQVRDAMHDDAQSRTLTVTTLLDGDVADLARQVSDRSMLARGMLAQVAEDAVSLHALGFVHHDVRTRNMLWHQNGRIVLADYGLARHVDADGCLERAAWPVVLHYQRGNAVVDNVAAPETRIMRYGSKSDVWGLGLAALYILVPATEKLQFAEELQRNLSGFEQWRTTLLTADGRVDGNRVVDPAQQRVSPRHYIFYKTFFAARQVDAQLTDWVLEHMLVSLPDARWSMADVMAHVPAPPAAALTATLRAVADRDAKRQGALNALRACYAAWRG